MEIIRQPVSRRVAWIGAELARSDDWISYLRPKELREIDAALRSVQSARLSWGGFTAPDFPLPTLKARLATIEDELKSGRGFVLLRGLDVSRYSLGELKTIYWGLSAHMGSVISQNARGTLIEHVTDLTPSNLGDPNLRLYVTAQAQPPHSDMADIVGLLCVDRAKEGGDSVIVSTMAIYNRMLEEHPEYLPVLYEGFYHDLRGEGADADPSETSDVPVPVFFFSGDRLCSWFHAKKIWRGAAKRGVSLTPLQVAAVEYMEHMGMDPEMRLNMQLEPGDIQLLNNYVAMHYRTAFVDGNGHKRLLLRIWLQLDGMGEFHPAIAKWIRAGVPEQSWAQNRPVPAIGVV